MKTPGIEVRPLKTMTGAAEFNEVFFTDVRVPKSQIVGERGQGWAVSSATLKHERGMLGDPNQTMARMNSILELMKTETLDGTRVIDLPVFRDRAMKPQGQVLAMQYHGMRLLTASAHGQDPGLARMIVSSGRPEINYRLSELAVDAMGELGLLNPDSPLARSHGVWQKRNLFDHRHDHRRRNGPDSEEHHRGARPRAAARAQGKKRRVIRCGGRVAA